jgi:PAS domain S-box-containing protein
LHLYADAEAPAGDFLYFMPFVYHWVNTANICCGMVFTWGVVCLILNNYYLTTDASVTFLVGIPFAIVGGMWFANWRVDSIMRRPVNRLQDAYEVELRGRYMLHQALWGHPTAVLQREAIAHHASSPKTQHGLLPQLSEVPADGTARADYLRLQISPDVVAAVREMYREAVRRFPQSAILHVFCARFYSTFLANRHMTFSHVLQADKRHPQMDVAYLVFQARKQAECSSAGESMTAMNSVGFEKHCNDAKRNVQLAAQKQLSFWTELMEPLPDLSKLDEFAAHINAHIANAESSFSRAFTINPQSLAMLRLYAAFNTHILCNNDKAGVLTAEADRIEDQKAKEHHTEGSKALHFFTECQLDLSSDSTAMITMDASPTNLGIILSANAAACKLFGFSRLQLERRSAFTLLPPLLAEWHEKGIRSYLSTGEGSIVDYTRIIFGTHKTGSLLPILSNVRDAPSDEDGAILVWMLRDMRSTYQYILLDSNNLLLGLSAGSAVMLGMDPSDDMSAHMNISTFIQEWDQPSIQADLHFGSGTLLKVTSQKLADNNSDSSDDNEHADSSSREPPHSMWIRAMLQTQDVEGVQVNVLHWKRLSIADAPLMAQAERKRARLLHINLPSQQETATYVSMYEIATLQDPIGTRATDSNHSIVIGEPQSNAAGDAIQETTLHSPMEHVHINVLVSETDQQLSARQGLKLSVPGTVNVEDEDSSEERPIVALATPTTMTTTKHFKAATRTSTEIGPEAAGAIGVRSSPGKVSRGGTKEGYEDGSVTSKSSSASRSVSKLRRYLSSGNHSLLRGLWWLRALGFALLLLAVGLAVAVSVLAESNYALMSANLRYIVAGADRMVYKANAIYNLQVRVPCVRTSPCPCNGMFSLCLQDLIFEARDWISLTANETDLRRQNIATNISMFSENHRSMYEIVSGDPVSVRGNCSLKFDPSYKFT